jgi:ribonuclease VapC
MIEIQGLEVFPIDATIARIAGSAAETFGHIAGHAARLNFGDCLSLAVAKHLDAPLLYKGGDFVHTDIESALPA